MIDEPTAPQPVPPPRQPGETVRERRERRAGFVRLSLGGLLLVVIILAVAFGAASKWWLLAVPLVGFDLVGAALLRREAALRRSRFLEPGDHRVVLQVSGDRPIHVIREIRRITGQDLVSAKRIVEAAPVVVVEGVTQESAAQAAHLLQIAGARAVATPVGEAR